MMTKFDTQTQYNAAIMELNKHFDDELDGNVYIISASILEAKNAKLLANWLGGQDTMPRDHVFKIIEKHIPIFAKEVGDIYQDLTGTEINFNEKLMSSVIPYDVN